MANCRGVGKVFMKGKQQGRRKLNSVVPASEGAALVSIRQVRPQTYLVSYSDLPASHACATIELWFRANYS